MALRRSTQSLLLQAQTLRPAASTSTTTAPSLYLTRRYHPTSTLTSNNNKDNLQDRESLNPRRAEGTNFGYDDEVAQKSDAAFNPKKTDPKTERDSAQGNGNPLDASGANQELSRPQNPEEAGDKTDKKTRSAGSKGQKHGKLSPM